MKNLLIALLLLSLTTASASVNPLDLIVQADPTNHTLILRTTTSVDEDTEVRIYDRDGLVLYTTRVDSGGYLNRRLQLAALPQGDYTVESKDSRGKTVQPLHIGQEGILADPALAIRTFFPRVNLEQKLLTINYLNTGGRDVSIQLKDVNGQDVISDRLPATTSVQRAYSLENLPAGDYFVTVSSPRTPNYTTSLRLE